MVGLSRKNPYSAIYYFKLKIKLTRIHRQPKNLHMDDKICRESMSIGSYAKVSKLVVLNE